MKFCLGFTKRQLLLCAKLQPSQINGAHAVSGTVPEEPVINRSNGQLFEKRLIEKHVQVRTGQTFAELLDPDKPDCTALQTT
jgi:hypothetical protein